MKKIVMAAIIFFILAGNLYASRKKMSKKEIYYIIIKNMGMPQIYTRERSRQIPNRGYRSSTWD